MKQYANLKGTKYHVFYIVRGAKCHIWHDSYKVEADAELARLELLEIENVSIAYIVYEEIK